MVSKIIEGFGKSKSTLSNLLVESFNALATPCVSIQCIRSVFLWHGYSTKKSLLTVAFIV